MFTPHDSYFNPCVASVHPTNEWETGFLTTAELMAIIGSVDFLSRGRGTEARRCRATHRLTSIKGAVSVSEHKRLIRRAAD